MINLLDLNLKALWSGSIFSKSLNIKLMWFILLREVKKMDLALFIYYLDIKWKLFKFYFNHCISDWSLELFKVNINSIFKLLNYYLNLTWLLHLHRAMNTLLFSWVATASIAIPLVYLSIQEERDLLHRSNQHPWRFQHPQY